MAMLNPMMTTDVAGSPCWMRPGGWTQVGILKTMGCMGSVVKPHKWLLLKRPWEFVKELFRTYLGTLKLCFGSTMKRVLKRLGRVDISFTAATRRCNPGQGKRGSFGRACHSGWRCGGIV